MTFKIEFARLAEKDLEKSFRWYLKYSQKVALQFADLVEQQAEEIAKNPMRWPIVFRDRRQSPVPGWKSHSIIYTIRGNCVRILSVFHASRNPIIWKRRK